MGDATLADFGALAGKVAAQEFPIMPQPTWGQDAAYVGFVIDRLLAENDRLRAVLRECRDWLDAPGGEPDSNDLLRLINTTLAAGAEGSHD